MSLILIICVVLADILFLLFGVKKHWFEKNYLWYAIVFAFSILTIFVHVHQKYHWTVILVDSIAGGTWGIAGIIGYKQGKMK